MMYHTKEYKLLNKIRNNLELVIEPSMFSLDGKEEIIKHTLKLVVEFLEESKTY